MKLSQLNIVLVEPQIPQNTGNISRTCAVTGARLHLVEPLGFTVTDKHLKRAGLDYWDKLDLTYYANWEDFCNKNPEGERYFFTTKGRHIHSDVSYPTDKPVYLVFGREDKGLNESLLVQHPDTCVRITAMGISRVICRRRTDTVYMGIKSFEIDIKTTGKLQ